MMRRHPRLLKSWVVVVTLTLSLSSVGLAYSLTHAASANLMSCLPAHGVTATWSYTQTSVRDTFGLEAYYQRTVTAVYRGTSDQQVECLPGGAVREQWKRSGTVAIYAGSSAAGAPLATRAFLAIQTMTGPIETAFYPQSASGWFGANWRARTLTQRYVWEVVGVSRLDWSQAYGASHVTWELGTAHGECASGAASCPALAYLPLPVQ